MRITHVAINDVVTLIVVHLVCYHFLDDQNKNSSVVLQISPFTLALIYREDITEERKLGKAYVFLYLIDKDEERFLQVTAGIIVTEEFIYETMGVT